MTPFDEPRGGDESGSVGALHPPAPVTPDDLMVEVVRQAAAAYHEAGRRHRAAWRSYTASDAVKRYEAHLSPSGGCLDRAAYEECARWESWCAAFHDDLAAAEGHLIACVMKACGVARVEYDGRDDRYEWPACAFEVGGRCYVVGQNPDYDSFTPVLLVVDLANRYRGGAGKGGGSLAVLPELLGIIADGAQRLAAGAETTSKTVRDLLDAMGPPATPEPVAGPAGGPQAEPGNRRPL